MPYEIMAQAASVHNRFIRSITIDSYALNQPRIGPTEELHPLLEPILRGPIQLRPVRVQHQPLTQVLWSP